MPWGTIICSLNESVPEPVLVITLRKLATLLAARAGICTRLSPSGNGGQTPSTTRVASPAAVTPHTCVTVNAAMLVRDCKALPMSLAGSCPPQLAS